MARTMNPCEGAGEIKGIEEARMLSQAAQAVFDNIFNSTTSASRRKLGEALGYEYQGDRDIYTALGYRKNLSTDDYEARWERDGVGRRIIQAPVDETWRGFPELNETGEGTMNEDTEFEKVWREFAGDKKLGLWGVLRRADLLSGIGSYGALFLGFDDAQNESELTQEVLRRTGTRLLYLTPLMESSVQVTKAVMDVHHQRYGLPQEYGLRFTSSLTSSGSKSRTLAVNWSRVIHIAEEPGEQITKGTPRLGAIMNRLVDLDRIVGASAEAFWRNAFAGLIFNLTDATRPLTATQVTDLKENIESFVHRLERYVRTRGVEVTQLRPDVADPRGAFEVVISIIAAASGIPKRILLGSERGELASSQDQQTWRERIQVRRETHVEPMILDPLIQRLIAAGVLPEPKGNWSWVWPPLTASSEEDRAKVSELRTKALVAYADSMGAGNVIPFSFFLRSDLFMGLPEDEATKVEESIKELKEMQEKDLEEERKSEQKGEEETGFAPPKGLEDEE